MPGVCGSGRGGSRMSRRSDRPCPGSGLRKCTSSPSARPSRAGRPGWPSSGCRTRAAFPGVRRWLPRSAGPRLTPRSEWAHAPAQARAAAVLEDVSGEAAEGSRRPSCRRCRRGQLLPVVDHDLLADLGYAGEACGALDDALALLLDDLEARSLRLLAVGAGQRFAHVVPPREWHGRRTRARIRRESPICYKKPVGTRNFARALPCYRKAPGTALIDGLGTSSSARLPAVTCHPAGCAAHVI